MTPPATPQRFVIVGITSMAALWMYVDRVCLSTLSGKIQADLKFGDSSDSVILGAFFLGYALCQIPAGTLADRYGQRVVLTGCILGWSFVTMLTGFVQGFLGLLVVRLMLGIAEAGAYPAAASLVKNWARPTERGRFSSLVALGGRGGGAVAPFLTAVLALAFVGWGPPSWTIEHETKAVVGGVQQVRTETLNWRAVFVFFGLCGIAVAAVFWAIVRDRPASSVLPSVSSATPKRTFVQQLGLLAFNRNMFLFAVIQFCANVGWAPLVTLLPKYLTQTYQTPLQEVGRMQSTVLVIGCVGMLLGGYVTDLLHQKLGPRWGRSLPIFFAKTGCVIACVIATQMDSAWNTIFALAAVAFLVDLGNPSIWAFAQDVGGKNVGAALGWGNMFGNLGAFASPIILTIIKDQAGWNAAFYVCAGFFAIGSVAGFLLNAGKPLDDQPGESRNA